jgi:hypothetical protein
MSIPRLSRTARAVARIPRRPIQSRTEAAAELVRLEYERERLLKDIRAMKQRLAESETILIQGEARMSFLQIMLALEDAAALPVAPVPPPIVKTAPRKAPHANARYRRQSA